MSHRKRKTQKKFVFSRTRKQAGRRKDLTERIQISQSSQGSRSCDFFYYKDKKWVIITEISKEVENNSISRLNTYARQYVTRSVRGGESTTRAGNGGPGGSY